MPDPLPSYYRYPTQVANERLNQPRYGELKPIESPLYSAGTYLEDRANLPDTGRVLQRLSTGSYGEIDPAQVVRSGTEIAMLVPQFRTAGAAMQGAGAALRPVLKGVTYQGFKAALPTLVKAAPQAGNAIAEGLALAGTLTGNDRLIDLASMGRTGMRGLGALTKRQIDIGEEGARNLAAARKNQSIMTQLASAKRLYDRGMANESIHKQTGWRRLPGEQGKEHWAYEISDQVAQLNPASKSKLLGNQLSHQDLLDAYPEINFLQRGPDPNLPPSIGGRFREDIGPFGKLEYNPNLAMTPDERKANLIHEVQHWIQRQEGWPRGGNPNTKKSLDVAEQQLMSTLGGPEVLRGLKPDWVEEMRKNQAIQNYLNQAGEVQARATAARMNLTPEQRRIRPPTRDYDRTKEELLYNY